jgi:hypothetical protein
MVAINISRALENGGLSRRPISCLEDVYKADELKSLRGQNNLEWKEHRVLGPKRITAETAASLTKKCQRAAYIQGNGP